MNVQREKVFEELEKDSDKKKREMMMRMQRAGVPLSREE